VIKLKKITNKRIILRTLLVLWAVALIAIGAVYYINSKKDCPGCAISKILRDFQQTLTDKQKNELKNRNSAVLLDGDKPIYVNEGFALSRTDLFLTFSFEQPEPITDEEIEQLKRSMLYRKYITQMPEELRPLYAERKLAVIQSKQGNFICVALADYFPNERR
jgi:hypothetical protein